MCYVLAWARTQQRKKHAGIANPTHYSWTTMPCGRCSFFGSRCRYASPGSPALFMRYTQRDGSITPSAKKLSIKPVLESNQQALRNCGDSVAAAAAAAVACDLDTSRYEGMPKSRCCVRTLLDLSPCCAILALLAGMQGTSRPLPLPLVRFELLDNCSNTHHRKNVLTFGVAAHV